MIKECQLNRIRKNLSTIEGLLEEVNYLLKLKEYIDEQEFIQIKTLYLNRVLEQAYEGHYKGYMYVKKYYTENNNVYLSGVYIGKKGNAVEVIDDYSINMKDIPFEITDMTLEDLMHLTACSINSLFE